MASLFVKGMLLKSSDEACNTSTRLKQRRSCEIGDLSRLNHHHRRVFLRWIRHGSLCAVRATESQVGGSVPLRAVLSPESPPLSTAKKVCISLLHQLSVSNPQLLIWNVCDKIIIGFCDRIPCSSFGIKIPDQSYSVFTKISLIDQPTYLNPLKYQNQKQRKTLGQGYLHVCLYTHIQGNRL